MSGARRTVSLGPLGVGTMLTPALFEADMDINLTIIGALGAFAGVATFIYLYTRYRL